MNREQHVKAFKKFANTYSITGFGCLWMAAVREEKHSMKKEYKQLLNDLIHTGFEKEEVILCLEDWIAASDI